MAESDNPLGDLMRALKETSPPKPDPHIQNIESAAHLFAEAMRMAAESGIRCVVLFEHYRPPRVVKVAGITREIGESVTGHYVQNPVRVAEVSRITDEDV